jgi:flagellar biosynthesis protein FlhF
MIIKKYVAKSMREALAEIKNELGDDAIILKTRKVGGAAFPFRAAEIEVTAARDEESRPAQAFPEIKVTRSAGASDATGVYHRPRSSCIVDDGELVSVRPWSPPVLPSRKKTDAGVMEAGIIEKDNRPYAELKEDFRQLSELVKDVLVKGTGPVAPPLPAAPAVTNDTFEGPWEILFKRLVDMELQPKIAGSLLQTMKLRGMEPVNGAGEGGVRELLLNHFPVAGPIRCKKNGPRVIAFVGPTGAGKTTTIAKLATHCRLGKNRAVSIITADTYRIAAIEQIRTFADIVKAKLYTVFSPEEAASAMKACSGDDLVFVDTAGRSRRNEGHMEELKSFLAALQPDEVHLVLSATTKDSDLQATVRRYRDLGSNRLVFTKLDETSCLGNVYNAVSVSGMPVSFLSSGQNVPDDIELAHPARFIERLWEGVANG